MPLKLLIKQAGWAGYLLLFEQPLQLVTARQRTEGYDAVDSSAVIQILYTFCCFAYAAWYLYLSRSKNAKEILFGSPESFLLLYILLCMASSLWSPNAKYSAFMAFQCLAYLMLIVVILHKLSQKCSAQDMIEWVMLWAVWDIFWAVIADAKLCGVQFLLYPFSAAGFTSGVFFFLALYLSRRRIFSWLVMIFAILSISNKIYFGIIPGLLLAIAFGDRKAKVLVFLCVGIVLIVVLAVGLEPVVHNTLFYGHEGVGMEYTSGRDTFWKRGWELCMQRPLYGYGFVAGERDTLYEFIGTSVVSMHNMFFSAFIAVGILGPLLLLSYFINTGFLCFTKHIHQSRMLAFAGTVCMVFVIAMTAPGIGTRVYGAWLPSVLVMTMISVLSRKNI